MEWSTLDWLATWAWRLFMGFWIAACWGALNNILTALNTAAGVAAADDELGRRR